MRYYTQGPQELGRECHTKWVKLEPSHVKRLPTARVLLSHSHLEDRRALYLAVLALATEHKKQRL